MAKPASEPSTAPAEVRVKLTQPHEHAGRDYPVGAEIDLPEDAAKWLIALKRATPATTI